MPRCISCQVGFPVGLCLRGGMCEIESNDAPETLVVDYSSDVETKKALADPISTGRKRAAVMYPIQPGQVCEWALKKNCGGGIYPVFGCTGRPAVNIHHGPDKSTLNNDRSNISVICTFCHNRWHTENDRTYLEPRPMDDSPWVPMIVPDGMTVQTLADAIKVSKQEALINELSIPAGGKDK